MTPAEAATVLAVVSVLDGRHKPAGPEEAQAKAKAWAIVLDDDMSPQDARNLVAEFYADNDRAVMPSDLNRGWRLLRKARAEAERKRLEEQERRRMELHAVPMPPEIRDRMRRMIDGTSRAVTDA